MTFEGPVRSIVRLKAEKLQGRAVIPYVKGD